jgi:hypothetical protein
LSLAAASPNKQAAAHNEWMTGFKVRIGWDA